jgi:predicted histone-like DNA-binding protein
MVKITPISKSNPQDTTAVNKFYAQAVATGKTDLERLAYLVSNQSTVREGDCYAVILSLVHNIIDELKQGRIVKLDKLGSFQIGVSSEGVATIEEVGSNLVKDVRVNFRPDQRLKNGINMTTVSFTKGS